MNNNEINKIEINTDNIKKGLEEIICRYIRIRNYLNNDNGAFTEVACKYRLELLKEQEVIQRSLKYLGIQDFQLDDNDNEIIILK